MTGTRALVLDANILVSAVLGTRVSALLDSYATAVAFFGPDVAYADARRHLPGLLRRRGIDAEDGLGVLTLLEPLVQPVASRDYEPARSEAMARIARRDADDWPVLAVALVLDCPIWTQDQDFFGAGVPTWTTDRVELYLRNSRSSAAEEPDRR